MDSNASRRIVSFDQPKLGLSREYLVKNLEDKDVQPYFTFMKETALLMGADSSRVDEELKEALLFEMRLANASAPREERRNKTKLFNHFVIKNLDNNRTGEAITMNLIHFIIF